MLESLINPKRAEKGPWKMFFIGILYASLSLLLVHFLFSNDPVLSKSSGVLVVLFCVMFSLPFMYYMIKNEETEEEEEGTGGVLGIFRTHSDAILGFLWLFLGFILAFSFWYIALQNPDLLNAQVETYCTINQPGNIEDCVLNSAFTGKTISTSALENKARLVSIIGNNFGVMIFTLIFSLIFGAGAVFVLAWNASVISAAIGIFTRHNISDIPLGILRYMIHGFPEIAAYFITALAGGIFGVSIVRNKIKNPKFSRILINVILLIFLAIVILIFAALMEVYLTPLFFQ
jgi:uncharacterized membrane protein SpoIIM required for sporulation